MARMADADIVVNLHGQFGYQQVQVHPSQVLGSGSYGSVVKATLDHFPCAAKILHRIFFKSDDPGIVNFAARFEQECRILRDLKHPCVVQFLSIVQDPNTKGPILLMELMKESLTTFLERTPTALPYHVQVNINHDITTALAYLHGNEILHRDLSSNNILLNAACQAKVTDFGMSKMSDANPRMTRSGLMQCPGTPAFMPPEALRPKPQYTNKLDTFSAGVLMIQTITRKFPAPTDASITREDPSSPWGEIDVPVSEMERRKSDINKVPATHPLLPIARSCLKDKYRERPTAAQLCQSLAGLKAAPAYGESATESQAQTTSRDREMEELRKRLQSLEQREEQRKKPASPQQQQPSTSAKATASVASSSGTSQQNKDLVTAAKSGDVQSVQRLIVGGANVNCKDEAGRTPLIYASWKGHVAVVQLLLLNNADVSICDVGGFSPLFAASQFGHTEIVDLLLGAGAGADVNQAEKDGDVPLGVAAQNGHSQTVQRLMEAGAIINHQNKGGRTPLYYASKKGHVAVVQLLLLNNADVSICQENGFSPLYVASQCGHTEIVDLLLGSGADVHQATTKDGDVPLGVAAQNGHSQTVQRLMEAGAIINHQNKGGDTALMSASLKGHVAVVQLLLLNNADVSICDVDGTSPLFAASQCGHTEIVDLLLGAGADVHQATTKTGSVPLGIAAEKGHSQTVQRLMEAGAIINHQNKAGVTALYSSSWKGHSAVVRLLLGAGARDIPTKLGNTAMSKAKAEGHTDIIRLLQ